MNDYNLAMNQNMKLVLFKDAVEHCCRIARILRSERGNGLLVGVGGMGKQSVTKLASHLNAFRFPSCSFQYIVRLKNYYIHYSRNIASKKLKHSMIIPSVLFF